ncbi:MAG: transposase [Candidatus Obscuribacter sp.]|nr:transposase [Candidatus Obscuribacter sp.]
MQYESLNLLEFQKRYDSEEACLEALFAMRRGFICKHCGHNDGYRLSARRTVQCFMPKAEFNHIRDVI